MQFDAFASSRGPALLRFAFAMTGDVGVAEDVVQDVLLRVYQRWAQIEQVSAPDAYVRRMVVNEYLSWRRKWSRLVPVRDLDPGVVGDSSLLEGNRDVLARAIRELPRRQQAVLALRYFAGYTDAEIAETLGCTTGTVRGYAARALASLRVSPHIEAEAACQLGPRGGAGEN